MFGHQRVIPRLLNGSAERDIRIEHKDERRLLFKLDIHIALIVMILDLIAFLHRHVSFDPMKKDKLTVRSNMGYANVQGLTKDIGLTGIQFNVPTSISYVSYVHIETSASIVFKRVKFSRMIPPWAVAMGWGLNRLSQQGFIQNYQGSIAT